MHGKFALSLGGAGLSALLMAPTVLAQQAGASMQDMEVQLQKLQAALDEQRRLVDQLAGELRAQRDQLRALQQAPAALLAEQRGTGGAGQAQAQAADAASRSARRPRGTAGRRRLRRCSKRPAC